LTDANTISIVPFALWKLRVLITGKYPTILFYFTFFKIRKLKLSIYPKKEENKENEDNVVEATALDRGAVWIPGRSYAHKFRVAFGSEVSLVSKLLLTYYCLQYILIIKIYLF
jgi:hypothetical protein